MPVKFTTDTGCPVTIVSEKIFNKLEIKYNKNPLRHRITVANKTNANIVGYANVDIQIKNWTIETEIIVVQNLSKDCLLGMNLLETCPLTKEPIKQLRHALEGKTPINHPKIHRKINKIQNKFANNTSNSNEWRQCSESHLKEFFDGVSNEEEIKKCQEKQQAIEKEIVETQQQIKASDLEYVYICEVNEIPKHFPEYLKRLKMETEIDELTTEISGRIQWTKVNLIEIESEYANEDKCKFEKD